MGQQVWLPRDTSQRSYKELLLQNFRRKNREEIMEPENFRIWINRKRTSYQRLHIPIGKRLKINTLHVSFAGKLCPSVCKREYVGFISQKSTYFHKEIPSWNECPNVLFDTVTSVTTTQHNMTLTACSQLSFAEDIRLFPPLTLLFPLFSIIFGRRERPHLLVCRGIIHGYPLIDIISFIVGRRLGV